MLPTKRLGFALSIVGAVSLTTAAAVIASGGGLAPGDYVFNNTFPRASLTTVGGGKGAPGFDVTVNRGLNSFQPENGDGSPRVTKSTTVSLFEFSPATGGGSGCFVINPADFAVSQDNQRAALHTTLIAVQACPGAAAPVTGSGLSAPLAGGGGGGGLVFPVKLDVTWTGLGVTGTGRDTSTFKCADYSTHATNLFRTAGANAAGTVSGLDGSFTTALAAIASTDTHLQVSGAPIPACFG